MECGLYTSEVRVVPGPILHLDSTLSLGIYNRRAAADYADNPHVLGCCAVVFFIVGNITVAEDILHKIPKQHQYYPDAERLKERIHFIRGARNAGFEALKAGDPFRATLHFRHALLEYVSIHYNAEP